MTAPDIAALTGQPVRAEVPLHGGDLSEVSRVTLADGTSLVAKRGPLVGTEARMLRALARAGAPVPTVLAAEGPLLLLEHLPEARPGPAAWAALGARLRALHKVTADRPGWSESYAFGAVAIDNAIKPDWPIFWAENRLLAAQGKVPRALAQRLERLAARLPGLLPQHPPFSLLHGDLWSGNLLFGPGDSVHLIDPACYHGDAEVDLAMLHLFGSPPREFAEAYGPLAPGWETRRAIYQLWPALVHLQLFGAGYRGMVERLLDASGV